MSSCPHAALLNIANFESGTPRDEIARLRRTGQRLIWQPDEYANGGHWLVMQRDDIDAVLKTPADFSKHFGPLLEDFPEDVLAIQQESMTFMDPPRHRDYRRLVDDSFRPKALAGREGLIRQMAREVIDGVMQSVRVPDGLLHTGAAQLGFGKDLARRIRRRHEHDCFRVLVDELRQMLEVQRPVLGFYEWPTDRLSTAEPDLLNMRCESRVRQNDPVARADKDMQERVEPLHVASSDQDIRVSIALDTGNGAVMRCDRASQLW